MTTVEPLSAKASGAEAETPPWRLGHMLDGATETAPSSTALIVGAERRRISYGPGRVGIQSMYYHLPTSD